MDPSLQPLLDRLDGLSEEFRELREGVHRAIQVAELDPNMALTRARKVLEHVIREVYERRIKEPAGTRPLEGLLQRLVKDKFLPGRLDAYANVIRQLGNVGTHNFGEKITVADVNQSLSQLTYILEWYFDHERPDSGGATAAGSVRPTAGDNGGHDAGPQNQGPTATPPVRPEALKERSSARTGTSKDLARPTSRPLAPDLKARKWSLLLAGVGVLALLLTLAALRAGGLFSRNTSTGDGPSKLSSAQESGLHSLPSSAKEKIKDTPREDSDVVAKVKNVSGIDLVSIPAGEFLMGSEEADKDAFDGEKPQHKVRITQPFYLGKYKVTVGQFKRFVAATGHQTEAEKAGDASTWRNPGFDQTDEHPVVYVSWNDADAFCQWLAKETRAKVRLPREAEWEYSCRAKTTAGPTTKFYFGDNEADLGDYAWYSGNSGGGTHPCGLKKPPNAFGLYDMHGLAWEWCADGMRKYENHEEADPEGPTGASASRVYRGGSWLNDPRGCRAANRTGFAPSRRDVNVGFRVLVSR